MTQEEISNSSSRVPPVDSDEPAHHEDDSGGVGVYDRPDRPKRNTVSTVVAVLLALALIALLLVAVYWVLLQQPL